MFESNAKELTRRNKQVTEEVAAASEALEVGSVQRTQPVRGLCNAHSPSGVRAMDTARQGSVQCTQPVRGPSNGHSPSGVCAMDRARQGSVQRAQPAEALPMHCAKPPKHPWRTAMRCSKW